MGGAEKRGRKRSARTQEAIQKVNDVLNKSKASSVRKIADALATEGVKIGRESVRMALRRDLKNRAFELSRPRS